jgi:hypothetical protein
VLTIDVLTEASFLPSHNSFHYTNPGAGMGSLSSNSNYTQSVLPPFDASAPFLRPLPLPLSLDPNAPETHGGVGTVGDGSSNGEVLERLWDGLAAYGSLAYALPDRREWLELVATEGRPWPAGIDLLQPMH